MRQGEERVGAVSFLHGSVSAVPAGEFLLYIHPHLVGGSALIPPPDPREQRPRSSQSLLLCDALSSPPPPPLHIYSLPIIYHHFKKGRLNMLLFGWPFHSSRILLMVISLCSCINLGSSAPTAGTVPNLLDF